MLRGYATQWTKDRPRAYHESPMAEAFVGCSFVRMPTLHAPQTSQAFTAMDTPPLARLHFLMRKVLCTEPCERSPMFTEFERAVRAAAADLRDGGSKPEHMVIALKRATERGVLRRATTREDDLHYRMILWGVREYFRCESRG